jgi:gamma-glutamyltranspeptidase/glutathione hydrolase
MAFRRPHTLSYNGMVVSPHPLATLAGARALLEGGNAIDAAVATNAVLAVTLPHMCGIGGDAFFVIYSAREGRVLALNASGRAPAAATRGAVRARGHATMPVRGPLTITVPGAVSGWAEALRRCGTMGLKDLLVPAIGYARHGFPATPEVPEVIGQNKDLLAKSPPAARVLLGRGVLRAGERLANGDLARSLERIAEGGADALYAGDLGRDLVRGLAPQGCLLAEEDLRAHRSDWVEPIRTRYRGHEIYQCPPNSQGITLLMMLNLLEGFDLAGAWGDEVTRLHLMIEAKKLAFADRDRYVTDPAFVPVPTDRLLSAAYTETRRRLIAREQAMPVSAPSGDLDGDTICLTTADGAGNWVCLIQSLYSSFGSGVMSEGTGILMQNRGSHFLLDEGHANRLEPGKRTLHTLMPGLVMRGGRPRAVVGTRGAGGQPQTVANVLVHWLDGGLSLQEALEAPRFLHGARILGEDPARVRLEPRLAEGTLPALAALGHPVQEVGAWDMVMGFCHGIEADEHTGALAGAADPRGDSLALGV